MSRTIDPNKTIITDCSGAKVSLDKNNSVPTILVDQTTRAFSTRINQSILDIPIDFYLSENAIIDSYDLFVINEEADISVGDGLVLYSPVVTPPQLYFGTILAKEYQSGTPLFRWKLTLDTRLPYNFQPAYTGGFTYTNELAVDGSVTEQIFTLPNIFSVPLNMTRMIPVILDKEQMDDGKFGGLPALTRGVTFRKKLLDGTYINYWNVHKNGEFRELAYDVTYVPSSPAGDYGFGCRLSYGGQHKHGVAIEILPADPPTYPQGEQLEIIIQDDLTGLLSFKIMFEGHANGEG